VRILIKIGGAQLEQAAKRTQLCEAIADARGAGHEVVIVHGGGNQIRQLVRALDLPEQYHEGLRVTDAGTAEAVLMVLGGSVNRTRVRTLQACGVKAVGLSGADGDTFHARPLQRPGIDLGYVGAIDGVDSSLVETLLAAGHTAVLATVAPRRGAPADEPFYNLNADHAAGPLCRALRCDALLFLTDVPGVKDASGNVAARLTADDCDGLVRSGVASGGMLPKLEAALMAMHDNPEALVKIAPADGPGAVLHALEPGTGTTFCGTQRRSDA
jgi:acetylglutamate kinase